MSGDLLVRDGTITAVGQATATAQGATVIEGRGRLLTPGLIDLHTHGVGQSLYETGAQGLRECARELGRFGCTCVLPTIIPQPTELTFNRLREIIAAIPSIREVSIPGLHLEGPFMACGGAACPTLPGDLELLEKLLDACNGHVTAMSLSPDQQNILPVIRALRAKGIRVLLTHTRARVLNPPQMCIDFADKTYLPKLAARGVSAAISAAVRPRRGHRRRLVAVARVRELARHRAREADEL